MEQTVLNNVSEFRKKEQEFNAIQEEAAQNLEYIKQTDNHARKQKLINHVANLQTEASEKLAEMQQMKSIHDAIVDTKDHITRVQHYMGQIVADLIARSNYHDASKLESPELEIFAVYGPKLKNSEYLSDEYKQNLSEMKPALDHHYANNSHHPQYYSNGVNGMTLMDLVEMLADWKAAGERHKNGNIFESIKQNTERFNLSPQLVDILTNTANELYGSTTHLVRGANIFNPDKTKD